MAIWLITSLAGGGWNYFWPVWVAVPWGVLLLVFTIRGLVAGPQPGRLPDGSVEPR